MRHDLISSGKYKSASQIAKDITENWVERNSFCPNCGAKQIRKYENNRPVADFICDSCGEQFELKSKSSAFSKTITDGAYSTMMQRLRSSDNPNFLLLNYNRIPPKVRNYFVVPKHFFTPDIIIKRNPANVIGRKNPWIGCNINLAKVPESGKVFVIKDGVDISKKDVLKQWKRTLFLREESVAQKGWTLEVMRCVEGLRKQTFSLDEVYACEKVLAKSYPHNEHIKEKIRQQLQILRDRGYLVFEGRGKYRLRK